MAVRVDGRDCDGNPRQLYADRIATLSDAAYCEEVERTTWLFMTEGSLCSPHTDYAWQLTTLAAEADRRGNSELYFMAHRAGVRLTGRPAGGED
jgi:hypothetical protein